MRMVRIWPSVQKSHQKQNRPVLMLASWSKLLRSPRALRPTSLSIGRLLRSPRHRLSAVSRSDRGSFLAR